MYILYKLEKRAETTDTLLFLASKDRQLMEEILLSLYDDLVAAEIQYFHDLCGMPETELDMKSLEKWCRTQMKAYDIVYVPCID